jgi:cytochrome c oxidase assembly factor CtaG
MYASAEAVVLAPLLLLAGLLLRPRGLQFASLLAAGALIAAAFATRLQPFALHTFLWAHLLQNVVLAEWAPALLVLAIPPRVAERADGFPLFRPLVALPLWLAAYYAWHLPWIYDAALRHPHSLLHFEHLTYLAAGVCVWWPVVHGRASSGAKAAYLFAAFVLASPLGLLLALIPRAIYPFYVQAPRTWGPGPLGDQQLAGVTMAAEEALVFFGAFTGFLLRFLADEQASGTFSPSATGPAARARPAARRAAPGSARPRR